VWVLSDEIYERLVYDGVEHASFAAVSAASSGFQGAAGKKGGKVAMWDRTLVVNGFSKVSHGPLEGYTSTPKRGGRVAAWRVRAFLCSSLISSRLALFFYFPQ
jgi:aspartate/methionine/tyrosine aminotransferase